MKCVVNETVQKPKPCVGLPTKRGIYRSSDGAATLMLVLQKDLRIVWNGESNHALLKPENQAFWSEYTWTPLPEGTEVKFVQE